MKKIVSLCLPTNGVIEWVFPVLDSIYNQGVDESLFEVIVTNNGDNAVFHEKMLEYAKNKGNLIYKRNSAFMFENQLEALKLGSAEYLKLINHRAVFNKNTLKEIISILNKYRHDKPAIYFSNGTIKDCVLNSFDSYVKTLGIYASWTTGVGIWKTDYDRIPKNIKFDKISPHSCILFSERKKDKYVISSLTFCKQIDTGHSKKGNYDLFKAFGVEELSITQNLYIDGDISADTLKSVKKDYKEFLQDCYLKFIIRKCPCSYDLTGFNDAMGIYYTKFSIISGAYFLAVKKVLKKILRIRIS
ncbi:MAG: hypothetical protein ACI32B_05105 [Erysipelotrichaceae bacterium]